MDILSVRPRSVLSRSASTKRCASARKPSSMSYKSCARSAYTMSCSISTARADRLQRSSRNCLLTSCHTSTTKFWAQEEARQLGRICTKGGSAIICTTALGAQSGRSYANSIQRRARRSFMSPWLAVHEATLATPICWSSVRLSSICQLSVMRPFSTLTRSVAMNEMA